MAVDYMQMLLDLMEERQKWIGKRDEAVREISRLSELIRATMNMLPPEQIARYEPIFERIEQRPPGLSLAIRACFTMTATGGSVFDVFKQKAGGGKTQPFTAAAVAAGYASPRAGMTDPKADGWMTPVEIRDALKRMGFPFENYKANPLASIHTTLKRMVPGEMEVKTLKDGQKVYRLKGAGEWAQAMAEVRQWLGEEFQVITTTGTPLVVKRREKDVDAEKAGQEKEAPQQKEPK